MKKHQGNDELFDPHTEDELPLTMTIPEAGRFFFNFSRGQSYRAAAADAFVLIPIGPKLKRVSVPATRRRIAGGN